MSPGYWTDVGNFVRQIGKGKSSSDVLDCLASLPESPIIESFEDRTYYSFPTLGFAMLFDEDRLIAVQFYAPNVEEGMGGYAEALPRGLTFADSQSVVLDKLGAPAKSNPGRDDPRPFVRIYPWTKFEFPGYSLHAEYVMDGSQIRAVTLGKPSRNVN